MKRESVKHSWLLSIPSELWLREPGGLGDTRSHQLVKPARSDLTFLQEFYAF